jgi:DNA invertase Pin-like site-specific DNA recombinase
MSRHSKRTSAAAYARVSDPQQVEPIPEPEELAYSYVRFSHPDQAKGDSLRRQTAKTAEWCQRNGIQLDTSLSLRDLGVSAFKGRHRDDKHDLGQFLKLVERGRIPKGSYLVIENLDRLSREDERKALRLWMDILDAGINIVQLIPETIFRHEKSDMIDIMRAIIELSRGHSESVIKSERHLANWEYMRNGAREGKIVNDGKERSYITRRLPAWIEVRDGKLHLIPDRAVIVRQIFQLAAGGSGNARIARLLTREGVPAFGPSGRWDPDYINRIVSDRRAIGELQPKTIGRKIAGEVLKDYYPAVVTAEQWERAQQGRKRRASVKKEPRPVERQTIDELYQQGRTVSEIARALGIGPKRVYRELVKLGRREKTEAKTERPVYLFGDGMVKSPLDGRAFQLATWQSRGGHIKLLLTEDGKQSFPYGCFEEAILRLLHEVDAREILEGVNGHDDVTNLERELGSVETEIVEANAWMDANKFSPNIARRITRLEARLCDLSKRLSEAQQKAANPLSATWGEMQALPKKLTEEQRLRLAVVLRQIIASVFLLVVKRGRDRLAAVQIWFAGAERHRDYLVFHKATRANKSSCTGSSWLACSLDDVVKLGPRDLRQTADAQKVEALLASVGLEWLLAQMEKQPTLKRGGGKA